MSYSFILSNLVAFCVVAGLFPADLRASTVVVRDGEAVGTIYIPADSEDTTENAAIQLAAAELNEHFKRMSGAELPVVTVGTNPIKGPGIVLGASAVKLGATPEKSTESAEGFRLLTQDDLLLIGGESGDAVVFGAMEVLRRLGCDWVMPGEIGMIVPTRATIELPDFDESQAPDFLFRRLKYRGYPRPRLPEERERQREWLHRHKGGQWRHYSQAASGHAWGNLIRNNKAAFDADPTMLALVRASDGTLVRRGPQIETTHPAVIQLFVDEIRATYEKNIAEGIWTNQTHAAFPIGPADGLGYSLSSESMLVSAGRQDPIVGEQDRTDECVLLGNRILELVTKDYPNAHVGFYSYSTHADYPARYKPHPNLVQIFAPINFSRFHSVLDDNSRTQAYYREVVEQWSRLSREQGNILIYRGYNWNLADNMLPFTKVKIWGEELPWYKEKGFIGLHVESTKSWSVLAASDYVFMRLAWDTEQDWRQLLEEFCRNAYGKGAEAMLRLNHRLIERQHGAGHEAGSYHAYHLIYDDAWVAAARADIAAALAAADTDSDRVRIGYAAHNIEALALYLDYHRATRAFDFVAAKAGYDAMMAHWQKAYDENTDLVANEVPQYLKRFIRRFVDTGLKHASDPYRIVHPLPDKLPTMFDPNTVGHRMNYHRPEFGEEGIILTQTFGSTWDAQGLASMRDGAVWYRHRFTLPKDAADQPIGLFIGGVEDEARVWINGQLVGTSGRGFSVPFLFDLTDGIKYDGENLLAIQVVRNSKSNEIGLGGIIRPSYIFAGPRLERKAPRQLELRRILPGGEVGEIE